MLDNILSKSEPENEEDERVILPHQVTQMLIDKRVNIANRRIEDLNTRYNWSVYKLPSEPSLNQLEEIDNDLHRLYEKVVSDTSSDETERKMIIDCRQGIQDLLGFYKYYDAITKPVDIEETEEKDGGVANVQL